MRIKLHHVADNPRDVTTATHRWLVIFKTKISTSLWKVCRVCRPEIFIGQYFFGFAVVKQQVLVNQFLGFVVLAGSGAWPTPRASCAQTVGGKDGNSHRHCHRAHCKILVVDSKNRWHGFRLCTSLCGAETVNAETVFCQLVVRNHVPVPVVQVAYLTSIYRNNANSERIIYCETLSSFIKILKL